MDKHKKISDYVTTKENFQRADIRDKYLKIIDPTYIGNVQFDAKYDKCGNCHNEKTLIPGEGILVCETCGETDLIVIDSDRPSYKDPPPEVSYFAYKRSNHLTGNTCSSRWNEIADVYIFVVWNIGKA